MPKMRQSLIGSAEICLRRAAYSMDPRFPGSTGEAREVGTAYHAGLEYYYGERKEHSWSSITPDQDMMAGVYGHARRSLEAADIEEWDTSFDEALNKTELMLYRYFDDQNQWGSEWKVLEVEWHFDQQLGWAEAVGDPIMASWTSSGTADLVLLNDITGETILADHKTAGRKWPQGKGSPRKSAQPASYVRAWMIETGERIDTFFYDVMTYKGDFERRGYFVDDTDLALLDTREEVLIPLLSQPAENLPGSPDSNLCSEKYCDYWSVCPYGAGSH